MNPIDDKEIADQLAKLYDLHKAGALSKAEFESAKRRLLGDSARPLGQTLQSAPPPSASKAKKTGCMPIFGIIVIIALAYGIWAGMEESKGGVAMVHGEVYLSSDVSAFNENGIGCTGSGEKGFIQNEAPVRMSAGGSEGLETFLSSGSAVHREGFCQFVFFGELRDQGMYAITLGEGDEFVIASCPAKTVKHTQDGSKSVLDVEVLMDTDGARCVVPGGS